MKKKRLDVLLVEKGFVPTREKAQRQIMAGNVLVDDTPQTKSGALFSGEEQIRFREPIDPYVSRGAHKLIAALNAFSDVLVKDQLALDVGASTGGFTQVLLERGAKTVFAVDVGHQQLDWKVRSDPRVRVFEKLHAKDLTLEKLGLQEPFDLVVADVSFISLTRLMAPIQSVMRRDASWITLIKPQFELTASEIGKGGIVRDPKAREAAIERVTKTAETLGLRREGLIESPITGMDGNQEYLALWRTLRT